MAILFELRSIAVLPGRCGWVRLGVAGTPSREALDNLMVGHFLDCYSLSFIEYITKSINKCILSKTYSRLDFLITALSILLPSQQKLRVTLKLFLLIQHSPAHFLIRQSAAGGTPKPTHSVLGNPSVEPRSITRRNEESGL